MAHLESIEGQPGAIEGQCGDVEAHPERVQAHTGAGGGAPRDRGG